MQTNRQFSAYRETEHERLKVVECGSDTVHWPGPLKAQGSITNTAEKKENGRH